ncbi:MAG: VanW family protein [Oscillospiraceae bacterium]|nr:VanW family protein [Oscillospiraceae bacterium]
MGLCAWATAHILPNSQALETDISGMGYTQAVELLEQTVAQLQAEPVELVCQEADTTVSCYLGVAGLSLDQQALSDQVTLRGEGFLSRGLDWLRSLSEEGQSHVAQDILYFSNPDYLTGLVEQTTAELTWDVTNYSYVVEDGYLVVTRGQDGMAVDLDGLEEQLLEQLGQCDTSSIAIQATFTLAEDPDFQAIYDELYVEAENATLDSTTYEVVEGITGVSFDVDAAQQLYDEIEQGESCSIPLIYTEPEITASLLQSRLFADVLGECTTYVSGSENRLSNVKLAGELCDGIILLPGETFSYAAQMNGCTESMGFLPAPAYVGGLTVDSIGGGVCQGSSTIYTAVLYANLEVVERRNHSYTISYLPAGSDAMYSGSGSDFKFRNNTDYPIKLKITTSGRYFTVQILGTKLNSNYVKMEFNTISTTAYSTVYKIDDSVPAGTTKVSVTPYTGCKVEAYRCVYSSSGTLISRTYESTSVYSKRDQVILVNSADAEEYGLSVDSEEE